MFNLMLSASMLREAAMSSNTEMEKPHRFRNAGTPGCPEYDRNRPRGYNVSPALP